MKVILQENVQKLGNAGDVVDISRGYFRNFLEPRKLAVMATPGTLKKREEDREALKRKVDKALAEARELADRVSKLPPLRIEAKAGESGKLYGKVTNKEVGVVLDKALETNIDKRIIKILGDVSTLGSYKVQVKLAPEIQAECTINVVLEGSPVVEATAEEVKPSEENGEESTDDAEENLDETEE